MATPTERPSLTKTLEQRYEEQKSGGAFDAKNITTDGHASLDKAGNSSFQSAQYTPSGFKTRMQTMVTELKETALNWIATQGHTTRRYKP